MKENTVAAEATAHQVLHCHDSYAASPSRLKRLDLGLHVGMSRTEGNAIWMNSGCSVEDVWLPSVVQ